MNFAPIAKDLFFSKNDPQDPRLGEKSQSLELSQLKKQSKPGEALEVYLLGYPDDEGIKLNGGRLGAAQAPDVIRRYLYRMTQPHSWEKSFKIFDLGNLQTNSPLPERHEQGSRSIESLTAANLNWLSFGGGHDYAYSDGAGFIKATSGAKQKPLVINLDAHLDVRPSTQGFNSGTAFHRLLTDFEGRFELLELGLQSQCNSRFHWQWAQSKGATLIPFENCVQHGLSAVLADSLDTSPQRPLYLSLDIDCLSSAFAPGCSQSWATGFHVNEILESIKYLIQNFDVKGLGIYEVSPPLDLDNTTSKTAALIAHHYIFSQFKKWTSHP